MQLDPVVAKVQFVLDKESLKTAFSETQKSIKALEKDLKFKMGADFIDFKSISKAKDEIEKITRTRPPKIPVELELDLTKEREKFSKLGDLARDTKVKIDQELRSKLQVDIAQAQLAIKQVRAEIKQTTDKEQLVKLNIEAGNIQRNITEFKRQFNNLDATGQTALSRLQSKFNGIGEKIDGVSMNIRNLAGQFTGPLGAGISAVGGILESVGGKFGPIGLGIASIGTALVGGGGALANFADKANQVRTNFTVMLGSVEKADKLLRQITDFAKNTPFTITGLREEAVRLLAYGVEAENIIPVVEKLGNASLGNSEKFGRLAYAYGQVKAAGKLMGTELRQITETGLPILDELAKMTGKSTSELAGNIANANISFEMFDQALTNIAGQEGGRYFGLMNEQSKTLAGTISNIEDSLVAMAERLGNYVLPLFLAVANSLKGLLGGTENEIVGISEKLKGLETETANLNTQLQTGKITVDEYATKMVELSASLDEAKSEYKALNSEINDNNEIITENKSEIDDLTKSIAEDKTKLLELQKAVANGDNSWELYRGTLASNKDMIEQLEPSIIRAENRLKFLSEQTQKTEQVNGFLSGSFGGLSGAIEKVSTAKASEEFERFKKDALSLINTFRLLGIQQLFEARATGDETRLKLAQDRLKTLVEQEKAIQAIRFNTTKKDTQTTTTTAKKPTGGSGGSGKSQAVKQAEEEAKKREELAKLEEDREKRALEAKTKREKETADKQATIYDYLKKKATETYEEIGKSIEDSQKKIEDYNKEIIKTQEELTKLGENAEEDLANRVVKIQEELKAENLEQEKRIALEKELALAKANTTAEDIARAELLATESETERIIRETAEKKAILQAELADLQAKKTSEESILASSLATQKDLEMKYTEFFSKEIDIRKSKLDQYIAKLKEANSLGGFGGGDLTSLNRLLPTSTAGNTTNTNTTLSPTIIINNPTGNTNDITRAVAKGINDGVKGIK